MHHHIHCLGHVSEAVFHDISAGKAINVFPPPKAEDILQVQMEGTKMINITHYSSTRKVKIFQEFCNYRISNLVIIGRVCDMYEGKEKCIQGLGA